MKIAHLCLSCFYIDGYSYQENVFIAHHLEQGHDVKVIASTETYGDDGVLAYTRPGQYVGAEGAEVVRLPYGLWPHLLARKLRWYPRLTSVLREFQPDLIFFHGLCGVALAQVAKYVVSVERCRLVVDCHEDFNNSAKNFVSRIVLHGFYRHILHQSLRQIEKIYAVTVDSLEFARDFYRVPAAKIELLPLGGFIPSPESLEKLRSDFRQKLKVQASDVVIVQTGKLDRTKLLSIALDAFSLNPSPFMRFVLAGRMTADVERECASRISADSRIIYLGWQTPEQLRSVLAGADYFLQPFGQTVTTQQAVCMSCAILVQDLPSHRWLFCENGRLFNTASELPGIFDWVSVRRSAIAAMREASHKFALRNLDYRDISRKSIEMSI